MTLQITKNIANCAEIYKASLDQLKSSFRSVQTESSDLYLSEQASKNLISALENAYSEGAQALVKNLQDCWILAGSTSNGPHDDGN